MVGALTFSEGVSVRPVFAAFIDLFSGDCAAIVNDFDEGRGGKIDDELAG